MTSVFKVIIAGGRYFNDYDLVKSRLTTLLKNKFPNVEIVSGCASGADALGERFANEFNFGLRKFPADWNKYGRAAGPIRNTQMAEYADALIAFWDGKSRGTKNMIEQAEKNNLLVRVIKY